MLVSADEPDGSSAGGAKRGAADQVGALRASDGHRLGAQLRVSGGTGTEDAGGHEILLIKLLGPFSIRLGDRSAGRWERPTARRLCQLVLSSPDHRVSREAAVEALFPELAKDRASAALSKALTHARASLSELGARGENVLHANRAHIWADLGSPYEVDLEVQQHRLSEALNAPPGARRDELLTLALSEEATLFEEELYAEWAQRRRERLEWERQEARLVLARDRARGSGRAAPAAVAEAWEKCLSHDPACEEAAAALVHIYRAQKRFGLADSAYRRCRSALEELGLRSSPALEEAYAPAVLAGNFTATAAGPAPQISPSSPATERRLVSVLFAQLSGPVATGKSLGPEEVGELVAGALAQVLAQVEAFGGTVTSVSGAGLVALFGAPQSHEDDPERALRAAFGAVTAAGPAAGGLSLRAGVETGAALVGPIGPPVAGAPHYGAVGEVVSLAAILQSAARAGSVLVGPATWATTEQLFEWGPTEEVLTSPGAKPVQARYLERPRPREAGASTRRPLARSAPLAGRRAEMSVVRQALREVTSGRGSVLVITGEAGLGKTRLVQECRKLFLAWVGAASGRLPLWLSGTGVSYASSRPYGLYQQLISAWTGANADDGDAAGLALQRAMKAVFGANVDRRQVSLLAGVLGLGPGPGLEDVSHLAPEQLQKATFSAVTGLVSRLLSHGPTLLVLEDVHWADPSSLKMTEEVGALTAGAPLLLVLTRRPEPDPGLGALERSLEAAPRLQLRRLELGPLDERAEEDLARGLLGAGCPDEVVQTVREGSEGNPLFMEQRLASLLEERVLVRAGATWRLDRDSPGKVPEALERLVRSRVDRLPPGPRAAIVAASVLGPEFGAGSLAAVTDLDGELGRALAELCRSGLLVQLRQVPEPVYRFRHGVIQEATYKSLLRRQRQDLHCRAAWALEQASAGRLEEVAGLLGHHYALGGENLRAVHYLEMSGDRAASAFANDEATVSYRRALELLGDDPVHQATAAGLWAKLGRIAWRLGQFEASREACRQSSRLAGACGELVLAAECLCLLGAVETAGHRHDEAEEAFRAAEEQLRACSGKEPDDWAQTWVDVQLERSNLLYWRNEPEAQEAVLEAVRPMVGQWGTPRQRVKFYSAVSAQRSRANRYMVNDSILADYRAAWAAVTGAGLESEFFHIRFMLGFALLWYGDLVASQRELEVCLGTSRQAGDKTLALRCLVYLSLAHLRQHDVAAVKKLAPEAEDLAGDLAFPEYAGMANAMLAWVAWKEGRPADVQALAAKAQALWHQCVVHYSWYWAGLWPLVAVDLDAGRVGEAVAAAREMLGPDQQRFPAALEFSVRSALGAWDDGAEERAAELLGQALQLAVELRYA